MPIKEENLKLFTTMQKHKKKRAGKSVYNLKQNVKHPADRIDLAKKLYKIGGQIKKGYLKITEPEDHPEGYVRAKDVFGNITSKRGHNNLAEEIENLIRRGEGFNNHSRRLQREYHQEKEIIKDLWDWIAKDYDGMTPAERKQAREVNRLFKGPDNIQNKPWPLKKTNRSLL